MKAPTRLYLAFFMQFIVAISLVGIVLYMQVKQEHDSLVINLAGRQRMLSQKITKEILLLSEGHLSSEKVANSINVFHDTLNSLYHGGKAPLDLEQTKFAELPKPESKEVVDQLQKVESTWKLFRENALKVVEEKEQPSLEHIKKINVTLLEEMNRAVFLMDAEAARKVQSVRTLLLGGCVALLVLFLITLRIILRDWKAD
ncbi:MAG: type IV pili methyl-accepting chemotaxis transducer N-terminal domain-containing protein [Syntrophobacteria bacterium]